MTRSVVQLGGQALKLDADGDTTIQVSSDDVLIVDTAGNEALKIDANGHVTKALQPAFLAKPTSTQTNVAVNTISDMLFGTEIFDNNGDFGSSVFTAPVTGKYQLNMNVMCQQINTDYAYLDIQIVTSNRTYLYSYTPDHFIEEANCAFHHSMNVLADMDANDTAKIRIDIPNTGSAQLDAHEYSTFSGYLVA